MKYKMKAMLLMMILLAISPFGFADCTITDIKNARSEALSLYKAKNYDGAEKRLSNLYNRDDKCSFYNMLKGSDATLDQGLWLISDLMFYKKRTGDLFGCLDLNDQVFATWMVSDPGRYGERVSNAIKTNATQCQKGLDARFIEPEPCPVEGYDTMYAIPEQWRTQNSIYYELACIRFRPNSTNIMGYQRDGEQSKSESMNDVARFEVLYVDKILPSDESVTTYFALVDYYYKNEHENAKWITTYGLDQIYFHDLEGRLWGQTYCYNISLKLGKKAGELFLDGSSSICSGGSASYVERIILKMDYPFGGNVIESQRHTFK